jgi:hypothetical protein
MRGALHAAMRVKNQEQEQVIEKIARSFFARKRKVGLGKKLEVCGAAP